MSSSSAWIKFLAAAEHEDFCCVSIVRCNKSFNQNWELAKKQTPSICQMEPFQFKSHAVFQTWSLKRNFWFSFRRFTFLTQLRQSGVSFLQTDLCCFLQVKLKSKMVCTHQFDKFQKRVKNTQLYIRQVSITFHLEMAQTPPIWELLAAAEGDNIPITSTR